MPQLSVDALNPSGTKAWRLLEDGDWRRAHFAEPLAEGDFARVDPEAIRPWLRGRLKKDWGGRVAWEATEAEAYAPGEIRPHAIVHREPPVPVPDREALVHTLAGVPEEGRHILCLDLGGAFHMRGEGDRPVTGDPALAAHGDSLSGRYKGETATADAGYVAGVYRRFLGAWYQHLRSGRVSLYAGETPWDLGLDELTRRIEAWTPDEGG